MRPLLCEIDRVVNISQSFVCVHEAGAAKGKL